MLLITFIDAAPGDTRLLKEGYLKNLKFSSFYLSLALCFTQHLFLWTFVQPSRFFFRFVSVLLFVRYFILIFKFMILSFLIALFTTLFYILVKRACYEYKYLC